MNSRKIRVAAGAALVFGLLSWIPAGAVTIGYPPAEPGGRCLTGFSVPLSGGANQLYKCVNNQWAVVSTLDGGTGPTGATGAAGTNGTNGTNGANGADGTNGTNGENGAKGDTGDNGAKGDTGDKGDAGDPGPAGPALAAFGMDSAFGQSQTFPSGATGAAFVDTGVVPPAGSYAVNFAVRMSNAITDVRAFCGVTVGGSFGLAPNVSQPIVSYAAGNIGSLTGTGWITVNGNQSVNVGCVNLASGEFEGVGQNLNLIPLASVTVPTTTPI